MSTLLRLKQADILAQIIALVLPAAMLTLTAAQNRHFDISYLIYTTYASAGAVQVVSCLANIKLSVQFRNRSRNTYQVLLAILLLAGVPCIAGIVGWVWIWFTAMFCLAPLMTIWYGVITITELKRVKRQSDRARFSMVNI